MKRIVVVGGSVAAITAGCQSVESAMLPLPSEGIAFRTGARTVRLETRGRLVTRADGTDVPYDGLVITTGARARRLNSDNDNDLMVRTLDDPRPSPPGWPRPTARSCRVGDRVPALLLTGSASYRFRLGRRPAHVWDAEPDTWSPTAGATRRSQERISSIAAPVPAKTVHRRRDPGPAI
jgi:hypothetical protein